jgi:superfamily II DNA or RNA helicase
MEHATTMFGVSFRKTPRSGQMRVFELLQSAPATLCIKLPTGYGKTFTGAGAYSIKQKRGLVTRLLIIFPTDGQLEQFELDGPGDLKDAGVDGPLEVTDVRFFGAEALKSHRKNKCQVFAITIQALINNRGRDNVRDLLETGLWMVIVDEYHHYGMQKEWGKTVLALPRAFLLAMSATPLRRYNDSAFGTPHLSISYREAEKEKAVKLLRGHSYNYRVDAVMEDGNIRSFTTEELIKLAGSDDPEAIERTRIEQKMRWSPKYVSPLVRVPVERMLRERTITGYRLQVLVTAMCVSHATLVCEQLKAMFPELSIDWAGTGPSGRTADENRKILKQFCPKKDEHGIRHHLLDVLVHVGLAGEGLDTTHVSEIVLLTSASVCNRILQIIGRASRYLEGVEANINFDASSEFAEGGYVGDAIMDAMEYEPAVRKEPEPPTKGNGDDPGPLPDEPYIRIWDMELIHIDSGSREVQRMVDVLEQTGVTGLDYKALRQDKDHPHHEAILEFYRIMRSKEAEAFNQKARIQQTLESVNSAASVVTGLVIRRLLRNGASIEKSRVGDIKKAINTRKAAALGKLSPDLEVCLRHYNWLRNLDVEIREKGIPQWLS